MAVKKHRLGYRKNWVFDMDGTLTVAAHDFDSFKAAHQLPADQPILEFLETVDPERANAIQRALRAWETQIAQKALPALDALSLLSALQDRQANLSILTRNTKEIALITLEAAGLASFFRPEWILGRDDAQPKPHPDGLFRLLAAQSAEPGDTIMVGDYQFDMEAGRAAGVHTALVLDVPEPPQSWLPYVDLHVRRLGHLLDSPIH